MVALDLVFHLLLYVSLAVVGDPVAPDPPLVFLQHTQERQRLLLLAHSACLL